MISAASGGRRFSSMGSASAQRPRTQQVPTAPLIGFRATPFVEAGKQCLEPLPAGGHHLGFQKRCHGPLHPLIVPLREHNCVRRRQGSEEVVASGACTLDKHLPRALQIGDPLDGFPQLVFLLQSGGTSSLRELLRSHGGPEDFDSGCVPNFISKFDQLDAGPRTQLLSGQIEDGASPLRK